MSKKGEAEKAEAKPDTCGACRWCVGDAGKWCATPHGHEVGYECHGLPPTMPMFQNFVSFHVGPTVFRERHACSLFKPKVMGRSA
jgi:hypothetical protein